MICVAMHACILMPSMGACLHYIFHYICSVLILILGLDRGANDHVSEGYLNVLRIHILLDIMLLHNNK